MIAQGWLHLAVHVMNNDETISRRSRRQLFPVLAKFQNFLRPDDASFI
jgi:hypothetical protein